MPRRLASKWVNLSLSKPFRDADKTTVEFIGSRLFRRRIPGGDAHVAFDVGVLLDSYYGCIRLRL
jgi:hypothetical protein